MLLNNGYTISVMRQNTYNQLHDMLVQENRQITTVLNKTSSYLASFSLKTANLSTVEMYRQDSNYYTALYKLKTELSSTLTSMSLIQGLFIFPTSSQQFIHAFKSISDETAAHNLRSQFRAAYQTGSLDQYVSRYWYPVQFDGHYYLVHVLKIGKSYIGAWTDFGKILSCIEDTPSLKPTALYIYQKDQIYDINSEKTDYIISLPDTDKKIKSLYLDHYYWVVGVASPYTKEGGIYLLVRYSEVTQRLAANYIFVFIISTIFLGIALAAIRVIRIYLGRPLSKLQNSLTSLRNGDFSIRLPEEEACNEFADVNSAFNQMVERIENLKISIYEEKLVQQKTEMQALKNQIAPHFLINCLNAIYHMAAAKKNDEIQGMTVFLGDHLRYALADVSTVLLQEELDKVRNYVALSKARFPGCIELFLNIPEHLSNVVILPMILLFQVENIIKYEVVNGEITEIHIDIYTENRDENKMLHLCIWDTGNGYAPEILSQLRDKKMLSQSTGHNIGTRNTYQRLHLMYGNNFSLQFSNRENAGAQIDICIPYQEADKTKESLP